MNNYTTVLSAWRKFRGSVKARAPSTRQKNKSAVLEQMQRCSLVDLLELIQLTNS